MFSFCFVFCFLFFFSVAVRVSNMRMFKLLIESDQSMIKADWSAVFYYMFTTNFVDIRNKTKFSVAFGDLLPSIMRSLKWCHRNA